MLLRSKKLLILYMVLLVVVLLTMAQLLLLRRQANTDGPRDFPEIRQEGVLRIAMEYSPTDYFIVGDSVLGFQYELCLAISSLAGIEIQTRLETSLATCFDLLSDRQVDVIAQNIPVTTDNKEEFLFTDPIVLNQQVLIQRKADKGKEDGLIRNQLDLAGKTLYIPKDSPAKLRLRNLEREIGDTIYIVEDEIYSAEQLIIMVAKGDIDYAVCDQHIAAYMEKQLPEIDDQTKISFTQFQSWAVRKESVALLDSLNHWLGQVKESGLYDRIFKRYYK